MASLPIPPERSKGSGRPRIETQIHRRKKARAMSALQAEWDPIDQDAPGHLRMPSTLMAPQPFKTKKK
jgi:hypothetical protein